MFLGENAGLIQTSYRPWLLAVPHLALEVEVVQSLPSFVYRGFWAAEAAK
jgi:hypothetical protein